MTAAPIKNTIVRDKLMEEFKNSDQDIRLLTYKISMDKFNHKYNDLNNQQKVVLKEYINSVDNLPRLKEFYITKINEIKSTLYKLNKSTKDDILKIKINEILSIINIPSKNVKINDNNLVDLLQYYELINELQLVNG